MTQTPRRPPLDPEAEQLLADWETLIDRALHKSETEIVGLRRHLHANPEPSGEERHSTIYLATLLSAAGIESIILRDGLGLRVDLELGAVTESTPTIAIRADLDALKLTERTDLPYASRVAGVMHACGHDAHSAVVFGIGRTLATFAEQLSPADGFPLSRVGLKLRLLFQPAEETAAGARWLLEQQALDGVDAILGLHVDPERPAGEVGIRYGYMTANCDELAITVTGRGGHAARPHQTDDPIAAGTQLMSSLYAMPPRSVDSRDPAVLSIGQFTGGHSPNVIPESVTIRGTLRTVRTETRDRLRARIGELCEGVGKATRTQIQPTWSNSLPGVRNDHSLTEILESVAKRQLGQRQVHLIAEPSLGGEDFAIYQQRIPGTLFRLGCGHTDRENFPLHSPYFRIDESCLIIGTRLLLGTAFRLSLERSLRTVPTGY